MNRYRLTPVLIERIARLKIVFFDFDGVFTDNHVYVFDDGKEAVRCSRGDGLGLRRLERVGVEPHVVSTESNPVVGVRCRKMNIKFSQGIADKTIEIGRLLAERGFDLSEAAFLGNDINDLPCLKIVGVPAVVQDAHPDVLASALYRTDIVGGQGAVREFCDLIADLREAQTQS